MAARRRYPAVPVYESCAKCGTITRRLLGGGERTETRTDLPHTPLRCRSAVVGQAS